MLWSLDIETENWSDYVLGSAVSSEGHVVDLPTQESMWEWYSGVDAGDLVGGHNTGRFDFLALIDSNMEAGWTGSFAGSGLVSLKAEGQAECFDGMRMFPMSLQAWSGAKDETGLDCDCIEREDDPERGCGGYCQIRRDMEPRLRRRLRDYCVQDNRAWLGAWEYSIARLESEGFDVRNKHGRVRRTVGGAAFATMLRVCDLPEKGDERDWGQYEREIAAYYGGRCEAAILSLDSFWSADINAAYPWALTQEVPIGKPTWVAGSIEATRALAHGKPGAYTARVWVPEGRASLLPSRSPKGRLLWACGYLEGTWTDLELHWAVMHGAKIIEVKRALVYPELRAVYKPYMEHVWSMRDRAKREHKEECAAKGLDPDDEEVWTPGLGHSRVLKFFGNAPSGKLAQSPGVARLVIGDRLVPPPRKPGCCEEPPGCRKCKRKGEWSRLGSSQAWQVTMRPHPPKCARPIQAAYLTSRVRCVLGDGILAMGDDWAYSDTDSNKSRRRLPDHLLGGDLGQYKDEGRGARWRCRGPKLYSYDDERGRHVRMKGFPRADEGTYERAIAGEDIAIDRGVYGIRTAFKREGKAFARRNMTRALRGDPRVAGTRFVLPDQSTVPLTRDENGKYRWPVEGAPDPEEILRLTPPAKKSLDVWSLFFGMGETK